MREPFGRVDECPCRVVAHPVIEYSGHNENFFRSGIMVVQLFEVGLRIHLEDQCPRSVLRFPERANSNSLSYIGRLDTGVGAGCEATQRISTICELQRLADMTPRQSSARLPRWTLRKPSTSIGARGIRGRTSILVVVSMTLTDSGPADQRSRRSIWKRCPTFATGRSFTCSVTSDDATDSSERTTTVSYIHSLQGVFGAVLRAGLRIIEFREHDGVTFPAQPWFERDPRAPDLLWRQPDSQPRWPLMFSRKAVPA